MSGEPIDGLLGQAWFKDRVWTFDYPGQRLLWHRSGKVEPSGGTTSVPLGFPTSATGERQANYPRIQVQVEGQAIDLLLDTGATVQLSDAAAKALGPGPANRGTSFITHSTFEAWREEHPEWRVIEDADKSAKGEPMIEVPSVRIGEHATGPVWFTRRADANFHEWMSQWMDRQIDGALGGSALQYFEVRVDYPNARAWFEPRS